MVALIPNHKDHGGKRNWLLFQNGVMAVLDLPFLHERISVQRTRGRPYLDALVTVKQRVRSFKRALGDEIDFDALSFVRLRKFLYGPLKPPLLLRAVGNAYFHLIAVAERIQN